MDEAVTAHMGACVVVAYKSPGVLMGITIHLETVPKGQFVLRSAPLRSELRQPASTNLWDSPASASLSERKSLDLD